MTSIYPINSLKVDVFLSKSSARFWLSLEEGTENGRMENGEWRMGIYVVQQSQLKVEGVNVEE